jgi:hypothetical protein
MIKILKSYVRKHHVKNENKQYHISGSKKNIIEEQKTPSRTTIINYLLSLSKNKTNYLEIGVRNPNHNFNHIKADNKYSVDPGVEFKENPVDFKMTSDVFFDNLNQEKILIPGIKFDVIFIDGLHLAEQVDKDIINSLHYIKDDGFIVLHDCNPPTEWHAREEFRYTGSPAGGHWNGTTWKAFFKWRFEPLINSCCVDTDWGVGILSKKYKIGSSIKKTNSFYEFNTLDNNRAKHLNLISFDKLKSILAKSNFDIPA